MKLEILNNIEFEEFAKNHKYANFLQNIYFAELKKKNGWDYILLGVKQDKKIVAGTLLLIKDFKFKKKIYYAPRGYLVDYDNKELFLSFDKLITEYCKNNNGMFLKIDPNLIAVDRDKDGNVVEKGKDNRDYIKLFKSNGYKEEKKNPLQMKWIYTLNIKDKAYEEISASMTSKTRQMIRKNEKNGIISREGSIEELERFKDILDATGERRGFASRSIKYLKDMYEIYAKDGYAKLIFADIMIKDNLDSLNEEVNRLTIDLEKAKREKEQGRNKITDAKLLEKESEIDKLKEKVKEYEVLKEKYGYKKTIGAILYINYGKEVMSFIGGAYEEFMEYQPFYTIHNDMIKYAIENKKECYNFYGISGVFDPKDSMYGIYQFKRGFGGQVVELIGEFDKKLSWMYYPYKIAYSLYRKIKKGD